MRYSLTSLMAIVFLIALVMAIWIRREPWELVSRKASSAPAHEHQFFSPDETRMLLYAYEDRWPAPQRIVICVRGEHAEFRWTGETILYAFPVDGGTYTPCFKDDNTIDIYVEHIDNGNRAWMANTYRRRFPEWWWGHFYRPEVWLSLLLIGVILTRIARNQLQAEKESGVQDSV